MSNAQLTQSKADHSGLWCAFLALVVGAAFFTNGHTLDYSVSTVRSFTVSGAESAQAVAQGSTVRKVVYLALGLFGIVLLGRRYGRKFTFADPLAVALIAYWLLCCASVLWSSQPSLTLRRVIVLSCCVVALFGVVRQLRRDQLVWAAMACAFAFATVGLLAEVVQGAFQPWSAGYRFAGTVHPNSQGQICTLACLSAYALSRKVRRGRLLLYALIAISLLLLFLTKSRTSALTLIAGVAVLWLPFARSEKLALASVFVPLSISLAGFAAAVYGADVSSGVSRTLTLGRESNVGSLTGRVPLWLELIPETLQRPLLGHGYLSFWSAWRIEYASEMFEWTIPDAHNEYIDSVLNMGLIGASLLGLVVLGGLLRSFGAYLRTGDDSYGFFAALITVGLVGGLFESGFAQPLGLVTFFMGASVAYVACRLPAESAELVAPRPIRRNPNLAGAVR